MVGVATQGGHHMRANVVVNCAGMWARQLNEGVGVVCPNQAAEHYYLITEAMVWGVVVVVVCVCVCVCVMVFDGA